MDANIKELIETLTAELNASNEALGAIFSVLGPEQRQKALSSLLVIAAPHDVAQANTKLHQAMARRLAELHQIHQLVKA